MSVRGLPKPGGDAHRVVMRSGRRHLLLGLVPVLPLLYMGLAGVYSLFLPYQHRGGSLVLIGIGVLGALLLVLFWRRRHVGVAVDARGVWVHNGQSLALIAWDSLAGVAVYESARPPSHVRSGSLELCPRVPPEQPGPVLWSLVRDDEPLAEGLGRLRYRIVLPVKGERLHRAVTAARHYIAPSQWCGESRRGPPYPGLPDPALRPDP
ncbi:hypothetical protein [Streptomyces sp. NPDC047108]|uniref:hypothetical protein n=1 Tax=Streptomyces sp. NPDC047108 TaxID=3155025 RepID=UPI00340705C2